MIVVYKAALVIQKCCLDANTSAYRDQRRSGITAKRQSIFINHKMSRREKPRHVMKWQEFLWVNNPVLTLCSAGFATLLIVDLEEIWAVRQSYMYPLSFFRLLKNPTPLNVREHIFIACQARVTSSVVKLEHETIIFQQTSAPESSPVSETFTQW